MVRIQFVLHSTYHTHKYRVLVPCKASRGCCSLLGTAAAADTKQVALHMSRFTPQLDITARIIAIRQCQPLLDLHHRNDQIVTITIASWGV